ncbi:MAG: amino acid ABC transporter substrate-binding protein [Clostridiales Family XIII bacterium]|jgi:polar amino acid transport system substrate-binding protein|nr:amino acid ABC transporter substrate-binding protein [Clostridiales Family XIII bacterium]
MKKKICVALAVLLIAGVAVFAAGCGGDSDNSSTGKTTADEDTSLKDIQDAGVLILGCDDEFPPMGFIDENGELTGFDIDLARGVAERLGVQLEVKAIDWGSKELELQNKNIDVIWNGYTIDADRNEQVEFTKPYLNNEQLLVVKADSAVQGKADLADKVVGVQIDSAAEKLVNGDAAFSGSLKEVRTYDDYQQALIDLKSSDRIDAVAVDKILINYVMLQEPGTYRVLSEALGDEYYGIGCRKGSISLREAIDEALDEMQKDGTTDTICAKWFDSNIVVRDVPKLIPSDFE